MKKYLSKNQNGQYFRNIEISQLLMLCLTKGEGTCSKHLSSVNNNVYLTPNEFLNIHFTDPFYLFVNFNLGIFTSLILCI